jgi:Rad3-related DNA helicase
MNLQRYNPYPGFRAGQEKAITDMLKAYDKDNKMVQYERNKRDPNHAEIFKTPVIQLNAPTASGKTVSLYVFGRMLEKEYNLSKIMFTSPQVALVEAGNLFDLPKLVGKANYTCLGIKNCTAEDCPFTSKESGYAVCEDCPYRIAKANFKDALFGATTFSRYQIDPSIYSKTKVLLIDESTNTEQALREKATLDLKLPTGKKITDKNFDLKSHLQHRYDQLAEEVKHASEVCKARRDTVFQAKKAGYAPTAKATKDMKNARREYSHLKREQDACGKALHYLACNVPYVLTSDTEFVYSPLTRRKEKTIIDHFKLLDARPLFQELIKPLECIVLASGTPTTDLLIAPSGYVDIKVLHPIPVERRLIYYNGLLGSAKASERAVTARRASEEIFKLHTTHLKHTIVHCGTYQYAKMLYDKLDPWLPEKVILQEEGNRNESLTSWFKTPQSIFLSIKFDQGISLDGPEFPLNIIAAMPFPNLGDNWIKARNAFDNQKWYDLQVAVNVQQACGRTTRGPEDWSETHIIDASFGRFYARNKRLFFDWFVQALRV